VTGVVDLREHVAELAGAVVRGITPAEQLSRARLAANATRDVATAAAVMSPYADGRFGPVTDLLLAAKRSGQSGDQDAATRLEQFAAARAVAPLVQRAVSNQTSADTPGLLGWLQVGVGTGGMPVSALLDQLATPVSPQPGTRGAFVPDAWTGITAVLDPAEKLEFASTQAGLTGEDVAWHTSAVAVDVSRQVTDWTPQGQNDLSAAYTSAVNATLEAALCADIIAAATGEAAGWRDNIADTLDAAEAAAASNWGTTEPIVVISHTADAPRVRRSYAGQAAPPLVVPTVGCPADTVIVFARAAVALYASPTEYLSSPNPAAFGLDVATMRYGAAHVRKQAAVIAAALP
jgi:hypothetical protein